MKVESSNYIARIKPLLRMLQTRLLKEYEYVSILASDSAAKQYSVSKKGVYAEESARLSAHGAVVKVYDGNGYAEYSFNEITENTIDLVVKKIRESLIPLNKALPEGLQQSTYAVLPDEPLKFCESTDYEIDPEELGDEAILQRLTVLSEAGRAAHPEIIDCAVTCSFQKYHKWFLSKNRDMEQNVLWMTGAVIAMASRGEEIKESYRGFSNLGGAEVLDKMEQGLQKVVQTAVELLDSEPIPPGEYECICAPDVTGMIVHEAFGHGVEMDMFVKKRAQAEQFIGQPVASELVTMRDGASAAKEVATYFFDDEGVLAGDTTIIEKGILKAGISDSQSAMLLGTKPTGNGRRESFERKIYTRMTNTFFEAGTDKAEDMIASVQDGLLLEQAESGMEDPKNWGIQCMVSIGREIKNGKLTGKIYSPIVLTGYVPDLLKSISMVSDEVKLGGGGFCGKGYKEWVKVSDGGPYIKANIRLG